MTTTNADIEALASAYLEAIESGDIDSVRRIYSPGAVIWHNIDRREQTVDDSLAIVRWIAAHLTQTRYVDVRRTMVEDGYVQQHVLTGATPSGVAWELPAMMRVWVIGGRITRIEEYLDSAQVAAMLR